MDFNHSKFAGEVNLTNTILPDTLDFSNIKQITNEIDFTSAKLNSKKSICRINLFNSDINKIKIDYSKFKLDFSRTDTISGPNLTHEQKSGVYNALLEKFRKDGFADSYEFLDIEFREFKASNGNWWDKILILLIACGGIMNILKKEYLYL